MIDEAFHPTARVTAVYRPSAFLNFDAACITGFGCCRWATLNSLGFAGGWSGSDLSWLEAVQTEQESLVRTGRARHTGHRDMPTLAASRVSPRRHAESRMRLLMNLYPDTGLILASDDYIWQRHSRD